MTQYRFSIYFMWQIGCAISIHEGTISIYLPFITAYIALSKEAHGYDLFGKYSN